MKRVFSISVVCLIYLILLFGVISYMFIPNVKVLNEINSTNKLSDEEKNELVDSVNKKYDELVNNLNDKYDTKINEINTKYSELENNINNRDNSRIKEIEDTISTKSSEQNKEFFKNGFSDKYYNLENEISRLRKEKSDLESKKNIDIFNNSNDKREEINSINRDKEKEISNLNIKRNDEISVIDGKDNDSLIKKIKSIVIIIVCILILLLPIIYIISKFNTLTRLLNRVKNSWSQIDVLLKQRADLIPNIVNVIKGYSDYEKGTLISVIDARNEVMSAKTREEEINANKKLNDGVSKLLILQEDYPELKSNENYMNLHKNLKEIEDSIASLRLEYNNSVLRYKNKIETFPTNIIANMFGFKSQLFFQIDSDERENVNVNL